MVLGKKVAIFNWEWGHKSAHRDGQNNPLQADPIFTACTVTFYLRHFSESRSSSGSTPSVRPSVRLSATLLGCLVCVICNSKSFHSFLFKLCIMIVHILKMCTSHFVHI